MPLAADVGKGLLMLWSMLWVSLVRPFNWASTEDKSFCRAASELSDGEVLRAEAWLALLDGCEYAEVVVFSTGVGDGIGTEALLPPQIIQPIIMSTTITTITVHVFAVLDMIFINYL